jgi:hypothetical protein
VRPEKAGNQRTPAGARLAVFAAASVVLIIVAGCGNDSSTSTTAVAQSTTGIPSTTQSSTQGAGTAQSGIGNSSSGSSRSSSSGSGLANSFQTYGSTANSAQKVALSAGAFSFFRALAASDYIKVCSDLSSSNRLELQALLKGKNKKGGGCAAVLPTLLHSVGPEARKACEGTLSAVRVKGDTAFVLFRPRGGKPSYFVLRREAGTWKALGLAPGTPLNPLAG